MLRIKTGETDAVPVTAGTLFLGKFDIEGAIQNPTNPSKATDFGIPFHYRPKAFSFKMKYTSGGQLIKGTLKNPSSLFGGFTIDSLSGTDNYKVYSYLEVRNGESVKIIGSFEVRGADFEEQVRTIPYEYTSDENPTHITLVFTSSADGNEWKGAIGSELIIDDLRLIYE